MIVVNWLVLACQGLRGSLWLTLVTIIISVHVSGQCLHHLLKERLDNVGDFILSIILLSPLISPLLDKIFLTFLTFQSYGSDHPTLAEVLIFFTCHM